MSLVQLEYMAGVISPFTTRQLSQGVSVAVVDLVRVGPDRWASYRQSDDLDKNSFYFVFHFETSSVITHYKVDYSD